MRKIQFALILLLACAAPLIGTRTALAQSAITIASFGGVYTESQVQAFQKPFTAQTGLQVHNVDYNGGLAEIKAQEETKTVTWDVADVYPADALLGCNEGYFEKIDPQVLPPGADGTPALKDFYPQALSDCGVGIIIYSFVIGYDRSKFNGTVPTTLGDFFDVKKFPQKRALQKVPQVNLEWALLADGVAPGDLYATLGTREGVDRAFKKLDTIKPYVTVWWTAGSQPMELLASGEVAMVSSYNGRVFNAAQVDNKPFDTIWDRQIWQVDMWSILKGAPHPKEALEFIKIATSSKPEAASASWLPYGPVRKSSTPFIGKHWKTGIDMAPYLTTAPENFKTAVSLNVSFWSDHQDELNERFNAWLAK
jgi:putative spermidine/putrescine transport system substrate-binding protein